MAAPVRVIVRSYGTPIPQSLSDAFILTTDEWDDFGTKCYYHLSYLDSTRASTKIGTVKILQMVEPDASRQIVNRTVLPTSFASLNESYISLGQEESYYQNLHGSVSEEQRT